jgi:hypothetical protein
MKSSTRKLHRREASSSFQQPRSSSTQRCVCCHGCFSSSTLRTPPQHPSSVHQPPSSSTQRNGCRTRRSHSCPPSSGHCRLPRGPRIPRRLPRFEPLARTRRERGPGPKGPWQPGVKSDNTSCQRLSALQSPITAAYLQAFGTSEDGGPPF